MPETVIGLWAHYLLTWIGFGTLVGLLAKAIFPGKDGGGALATVVIGIMGSVTGAGVLVYFSEDLRVSPISLLGFIVAIAGTLVLLFSFRLMNGKFIQSRMPKWKWSRPHARHKVIVEE